MAADRQRLNRAAPWGGGLRFGPAGTAAWCGDIDALSLPRLAPTPSDVDDAGRRSGEARRWFLARRTALRHLVARHLDCEAETVVIGYDGPGAPRVRVPRKGAFVSVSGRGPAAGLAVSFRPVGIDLEPLAPEPLAPDGTIPWAVLAPAERASIEALADHERNAAFLRHWTAKEAYLKALGTGLLRDPAEASVCWTEAGGFVIRDEGRRVAGQGAGFRCEARGAAMIAAWFVAAHEGDGTNGDQKP